MTNLSVKEVFSTPSVATLPNIWTWLVRVCKSVDSKISSLHKILSKFLSKKMNRGHENLVTNVFCPLFLLCCKICRGYHLATKGFLEECVTNFRLVQIWREADDGLFTISIWVLYFDLSIVGWILKMKKIEAASKQNQISFVKSSPWIDLALWLFSMINESLVVIPWV